MTFVVAVTQRMGERLAEIGFLLMVVAGLWYAAAQRPRTFRVPAARRTVSGIALALGAVLLLVAVHWGHFGTASARRSH